MPNEYLKTYPYGSVNSDVVYEEAKDLRLLTNWAIQRLTAPLQRAAAAGGEQQRDPLIASLVERGLIEVSESPKEFKDEINRLMGGGHDTADETRAAERLGPILEGPESAIDFENMSVDAVRDLWRVAHRLTSLSPNELEAELREIVDMLISRGFIDCGSRRLASDAIRPLLQRACVRSDDPELDATDNAHPAWWRGHDHTTQVFCQKVNDILDGKDDGAGVANEPWESTRRALLYLSLRCADAARVLHGAAGVRPSK